MVEEAVLGGREGPVEWTSHLTGLKVTFNSYNIKVHR